MKRILRSVGVLLVISALFTPAAQAYLTVQGNGTAPATANGTTFLAGTTVNQAVFFRPTGEYYFGLSALAGNASYALSFGKYRAADTAPVLTPLGSNAAFSGLNINNLAVVPNSNDATSPTIVTSVGATAATGTGFLQAISKTVTTPAITALALGDTTGTALTATSSIRGLTASRSSVTGANLVFAAVKASGSAATTVFGGGAPGTAGTALDGINAALITQTAGTPVFTSVGANGVANSNTAIAVNLLAAGAYRTIAGVNGAILDVQGVTPAFCYDEVLSCLYVGIQGQTTAGFGGASIIGVGVYPVTSTATTVTVTPASVATGIGNLAAIAANSIICTTGAGAATVGITNIFKLKTMHTSTGMAYLIVNGNSTEPAAAITTALQGQQVINQIWAVPLVGTNAAVAGTVGSFANIRSGQHVLQAAAAGDLITTDSAAAKVGGSGILPVAFGTVVAPVVPPVNSITDIYVDGDAVYVATGLQAVGATASTASETGLWKSQCVFNDLGQIDHWTDWQKVAPNDMGGNVNPATGDDPRIDFAAVDSYTGHVWAINNTRLTANVTQWTQPTATPNSQEFLASAVNSALGTACYSVLDLNASVTAWGGASPTQITMFGGQEKVCFAVTGSRWTLTGGANSVNGTYTSLNHVMTNATFDYTNSFTFITTSLPAGAGAVVSLGFSGWDATGGVLTPGYFLAGCAGTAGVAPALYAWTATATLGFNPTTLGNDWAFSGLGLTVSPAGTTGAGSWQKVANVSGMPIKIQGFGGGLHVLTRSATIDRIYSCPRSNNFALLNSNFVVTASSGVTPGAAGQSDLADVTQIYDFVVSVSAQADNVTGLPTAGVEQLLMLTNDGVYTTSSLVGMQAPTSQLNAGWQLIDGPTAVTQGLFSDYIQYPAYNRAPQTFWSGIFAANPAIANVYNKNFVMQTSRQSFLTPPGGGAAQATLTNAINYNANPTATATFDGAQSFNQTAALTIYANFPVLYRLFYNDGARRFFIQKNPNDDTKYQVLALPYNLYDYNITANGKAPMSDAVVAQAGAFYWMSPIGDTGRLMMGTSNGVISLQ